MITKTNDTKFKIAKVVSLVTQPPIICIPVFLILSYLFTNGNFTQFVLVESICLIFTSIAPMAIILIWAKKLNTDIDISNRKDRPKPLIVGSSCYFLGFLILYLIGAPSIITFLLLCYATNTILVLLISIKWKISIHTTGLIGPASILIVIFGEWGIILGLIFPILIWSRVTLKKHTMAQAVVGGVLAYIVTIGELYLFIAIFNLSTYHVMPLIDVFWIVLALVLTPVILAILGHFSNKNNLNILFYILIILCLILFILQGVGLVAFILTTIISILISLYAGNTFSWYNIITF